MNVAFRNKMELESPLSQRAKYRGLKERRNARDDENDSNG